MEMVFQLGPKLQTKRNPAPSIGLIYFSKRAYNLTLSPVKISRGASDNWPLQRSQNW